MNLNHGGWLGGVFVPLCGCFTLGYPSVSYEWSMVIVLKTQIKTWIINPKLPNVIWYSAKCYSIFALRSNNLTPNHQCLTSSTIQLRQQTFMIRLDDKSPSGTLLRRNLLSTFCLNVIDLIHFFQTLVSLHLFLQLWSTVDVVTTWMVDLA